MSAEINPSIDHGAGDDRNCLFCLIFLDHGLDCSNQVKPALL